jgi:hypothetical protein
LVTWQREVKLCKVSDGTRVVGKCHRSFLIRCFGSGKKSGRGWRNIPLTVRKNYTTFSTEQIMTLRSVNKIFPESYDFAASMYVSFNYLQRHDVTTILIG